MRLRGQSCALILATALSFWQQQSPSHYYRQQRQRQPQHISRIQHTRQVLPHLSTHQTWLGTKPSVAFDTPPASVKQNTLPAPPPSDPAHIPPPSPATTPSPI